MGGEALIARELTEVLTEARACRVCEPDLPLGARPVVVADVRAKILIIGQAPGTRVHHSGVPWDDPSGDRLRQWLQMDREQFYDASQIAIMPMGLCYPGKGRSGDLPPRPECAPLWHRRIVDCLADVQLILLVGQYAQRHYSVDPKCSLTERVRRQPDLPRSLCLPHPSPRNQLWMRKNSWFDSEIVPILQGRTDEIFGL